MGTEKGRGNLSAVVARLARAATLSCALSLGVSHAALAQTSGFQPTDPNAQIYLEGDTLVYDNDAQIVTLIGGVRIEYDGNRLVAQRVTYNQRTGRLKASGNVEIIERDGNRITASEVDVTDDFAQGFVNALRVETTDKTYFSAESAERQTGDVTTFNQGTYTACEPCEEDPGKAPIWRIKARKIIWDGKSEVVRFERARFELFGHPIAYLPVFEIADPRRKRKSGFLMPSYNQTATQGYGIKVPYFFALHPTYDLTVTPTYYTRQGFMAEAEFRKRFDNGEFSIKAAGIRQRNPARFVLYGDLVSGAATTRLMAGTKGRFEINPRWVFGWDVLVQSDKNFANTYQIEGYNEYFRKSEIYLTGLNDRNHFDLRFMRFNVQENILNTALAARDPRQPWVLPSFDYTKTFDEPVAGGELKLDINGQVVKRDLVDCSAPAGTGGTAGVVCRTPLATTPWRVPGVGGTSGRLSAELEWKRQFVTDSGVVLTPLLAARGDAIISNPDANSAAVLPAFAAANGVPFDPSSSWFRGMATAGLEVKYPILFATPNSSHVFEPIAQIFARPDAPYQRVVGIPNEDAQSLVFDAATLFERDKFSGWDRIEGGTRANLGFRYSGTFSNGWTANAIAGQSFHLAGANPYTQPDLLNVGSASGLETSRSDYVAAVSLAHDSGFSASVGGRFDERTMQLRRLEARASATGPLGTIYARYADIEPQPLYGFANPRREFEAGGSLRFAEFWKVYGNATYDTVSDRFVKNEVGFEYEDECTIFGVNYVETRQTTGAFNTTQSIGFKLAFRTVGEYDGEKTVGD